MADTTSRTGVPYVNPAILELVERVHAAHDPALERAYRSPELHGMPAISLAPSEGKLLQLLTRLCGAKRAIEIGTLAGYSAVHIARGLADGGELHTLEIDPRHAEIARANIEAAGLSARVHVHVGSAAEILPGLEALGPFDLVFLDADKAGYPEYASWAADNLRPGGLLIADNAYYFGALLADDPSAQAMRRFHEALPARFASVCAPTPDGLVIAIRNSDPQPEVGLTK
jgi:caffeoyl-CoA O-methyltransferase